MMCCGLTWFDISDWFQHYDNLQRLAIKLIYAQIITALIGSLAPLYNGVLLLNLMISLFALVAIESSNQSLARTYAVLLFSSVFLDVFWFLLFSYDIWHAPSEFYGTFVRHLLKLTLAMQITGSSVKLLSSLVWIQMYRLGASNMDTSGSRDTDVSLRNSFLNPATPTIHHPSGGDGVVGSSSFDPASYSPLFDDAREETYPSGASPNPDAPVLGSISAPETSPLNPSIGGRSFHFEDGENSERKIQVV